MFSPNPPRFTTLRPFSFFYLFPSVSRGPNLYYYFFRHSASSPKPRSRLPPPFPSAPLVLLGRLCLQLDGSCTLSNFLLPSRNSFSVTRPRTRISASIYSRGHPVVLATPPPGPGKRKRDHETRRAVCTGNPGARAPTPKSTLLVLRRDSAVARPLICSPDRRVPLCRRPPIANLGGQK